PPMFPQSLMRKRCLFLKCDATFDTYFRSTCFHTITCSWRCFLLRQTARLTENRSPTLEAPTAKTRRWFFLKEKSRASSLRFGKSSWGSIKSAPRTTSSILVQVPFSPLRQTAVFRRSSEERSLWSICFATRPSRSLPLTWEARAQRQAKHRLPQPAIGTTDAKLLLNVADKHERRAKVPEL